MWQYQSVCVAFNVATGEGWDEGRGMASAIDQKYKKYKTSKNWWLTIQAEMNIFNTLLQHHLKPDHFKTMIQR